MLIIFVDTNLELQNKVQQTFKFTHNVQIFSEVLDSYKWIKKNQVPDIFISEINLDDSMGFQAINFFQTKVKLKNTDFIGFSDNVRAEQKSYAKAEGVAELFNRTDLIQEVATFIKYKERQDKNSNKKLLVALDTKGSSKTVSKKVSLTNKPISKASKTKIKK